MASTKIEITAEDKTAAAFRSAEKNLKSFNDRLDGLQNTIVGLAGGAIFGALINKGLEFADSLDEMAKKTGLSTTRLQELQFAGAQLNAKTDDLNEALLHFTRRIGDAAAGSDEARDALLRVGIGVDDLRRKNVDQLFDQAQASLAGMASETRRLSAEQDVFGKGAKDVANFLSAQRSEMDALRQKAHELGAVLSEESIAKAKETKDKFEALSRVISVQLSDAVVQLAPLLIRTAQALGDIARLARFASQELGLMARNSVEDYDALLRKRMEIDEKVRRMESRPRDLFSIDGKNKEQLQAELADLDRQLAEKRKQMAADEKQHQANAAAHPAADVVVASKRDTRIDLDMIEENARIEKYYTDRVAKIQESLLTEQEVLNLHYSQDLEALDIALNQKIITQAEYQSIRERMELEHQAKLGNISAQGILERRRFEEMNTTQQTQFVLGQILQLTQGVAAHNKTMFQINKIAGIANAIINTSLGVTKALSAYPPPLSIAMAAIQFAAGMAQVQQIKSAQFGGATSAPSVGGGSAVPTTRADTTVPALSTTSAAKPAQQLNIVLQSRSDRFMFTAQELRDLLSQLQDQVNDGAAAPA